MYSNRNRVQRLKRTETPYAGSKATEEIKPAADAGDEEAEPPAYLHPRAPPRMEEAAEAVRHSVTEP
jgi:hypothetical protein